jgi:hypothetical protein
VSAYCNSDVWSKNIRYSLLGLTALDYSLHSDFARVGSDANLTENNMRFSILEIITASVVLFFGCQASLMAEVNATSQKADEQPAAQSTGKAPTAQSTGKAPAATIPPQPAWRGYYPHRPYYRPYRRSGSGSGFGFGSGSGPSFGSRRGPGWDDWGRDPFYDDPFMNDPFMDDPFYGRDPWRRNRSGSGFGFGNGSGPSWGSGSGPRFYDRGRGPRDWDSGGMGFGW